MSKLIVIDGLDGSGKETQSNLLYNNLKNLNANVHKITFPNYSSKSSEPIKMYLNGEISNNIEDISTYACSALYSIDRYITYKKDLESIFNQEDAIIITDRYVSANVIHQASKIDSLEERIEYLEWLYNLEYERFGVPKENIVIYLDMPIWTSQELMNKRYGADNTKKDLHERNTEYLEKCRETALKSIKYLNSVGDNWKVINCLYGNEIRTVHDIAQELLELVLKI